MCLSRYFAAVKPLWGLAVLVGGTKAKTEKSVIVAIEIVAMETKRRAFKALPH